jgi:hypothetical protein
VLEGLPLRHRAVRYARSSVGTTGRLTAPLRLQPSFLVVGAQRCGTTSLHRLLARHPNVAPAALHKGVHYFDVSYSRGPAWYRGHFPLALPARLRHGGATPITGESSPYYMFHPLAPARIAKDMPGIKLIVSLRDPVERAYSAYAHEFARGFETESFPVALDLEPERLAGEEEKMIADPRYLSLAHQHQAYASRGCYADQLVRLLELFPPESVLVLDSARLFADPQEQYDRLLDFLGLPSWQLSGSEHANARPRSAMPAAVRQRLQNYFAPHDARLTELLGWTPSWTVPAGQML